MPSVKLYFEERMQVKIKEEYKLYLFYDIHDGKMLYLLLQHSQWNRKHNPFLLCECSRGEGVKNNRTHVCTMLSHERQIQLYDKSLKRWDLKRRQVRRSNGKMKSYSYKDHMDWIDINNAGCSHFVGFIPT